MGVGNIFDIGTSGIAAQRLALEVTGENIANVNTEGYSRQQVNMVSKLAINTNGVQIGTGVRVNAVLRSYDNMLQQQLVTGNSSYQDSLARQTSLDQIQPSFNELNADGLGSAISGFFSAWQDLSLNPQGTAERQALLSKSGTLVDNFRQVNTSLSGVADGADNDLFGITAEITTLAKNLAQLNSQILSTNAVGGNANELLDQRDLLVRDLSEQVGVSWDAKADGTVNVDIPGLGALVSGTHYASVYTSDNGVNNDVKMTSLSAGAAAGDATLTSLAEGIGGKLGGTLAVRDFIVPGYLASLDSIAGEVIDAVNTQHALGVDLAGNPGAAFFSGTTSADIDLDAALTSNKVAASLGGGVGDNRNALQMAALQNLDISFTTPSGSTVTTTTERFYNSLSGTVGIDVKGTQAATAQGNAFLKQLNNLRSSNSGVSLDEELTNMIKYQQAFQGSARLIETARNMLDTVLGMIR